MKAILPFIGQPCSRVMWRRAIAAAAALIAAGCDPYALNNEGKLPAALVVQHQDVSSCAKLLEVLLGQPGGSGSRSASGDVARIASANATAAASGHAGSSEVGQLASRCSAPPLLEPEMALCPVCLEPGACFTGPCGHLVCEGCAQAAQVRGTCTCLHCCISADQGLGGVLETC